MPEIENLLDIIIKNAIREDVGEGDHSSLASFLIHNCPSDIVEQSNGQIVQRSIHQSL